MVVNQDGKKLMEVDITDFKKLDKLDAKRVRQTESESAPTARGLRRVPPTQRERAPTEGLYST